MSSIVPTASVPTVSGSTTLSSDQLNMTDFLNLLTTQLSNQDPLNPMSDSDFFAQMAQLGEVQGMDTLNNSSLVQQAQSLMGKTVTAANPNAATSSSATPTITGVVTGLSIQNGKYLINIQDSSGNVTPVQMSAIQAVQSQTNLSGAANLIGQTVTGTTTTTVNGVAQSGSVSGTVSSVSIVNGVPSVTLNLAKGATTTIPVSSITTVN